MPEISHLTFLLALTPFALMAAAAFSLQLPSRDPAQRWQRLHLAAGSATLCALASLLFASFSPGTPDAAQLADGWLQPTMIGLWIAALVQLLGTVIGVFSSRYLQGEPGQARYATALAAVLASVHLLLLADHWLLLIAAWAAVGFALQPLLCHYRERPFALLAAHKKRIADRTADALLVVAAALAWAETGSGSLSALWAHLAQQGASPELQGSALCVVLAVILRTALLPVHGWLIQVMEAPTPVSALLHAGVVNLGGFMLIRFAPLLEAVPAARWLLAAMGLATACLAGLVMLTRISIKVRLAWSTVAQMGFMLLECALGLYTLAALHLVGHSLYKAHAFLSASTAVADSKQRMLRGTPDYRPASLLAAPLVAMAVEALLQQTSLAGGWPWWWSCVLAFAWAPLLWQLRSAETPLHWPAGVAMVGGLTLAASLAHLLPFGLADAPFEAAGIFSLLAMGALYLCLVALHLQPEEFAAWRRWSYAGFYVDEFFTRLALGVWPGRWTPASLPPTNRAH